MADNIHPSSTTTNAPTSPKSLAFQRLKLDIEQFSISQTFDERIASVQAELSQLETMWKQSPQTAECWAAQFENKVLDLQFKMSKLNEEKLAMNLEMRQQQLVLDECIQKFDAARVEELRILLEKVKIIQIHYSDGKRQKNRRIRAVKFFSELYDQIQSMFEHHKLLEICTLEGDVIGSQDELFFAYQNVKEQTLHVQVELKSPSPTPAVVVGSSKKKRRAPWTEEQKVVSVEEEEEEEESTEEEEEEEECVRHSGVWSTSEMVLFEEGVKRYGWGSWSEISRFIKTRDRKQVRKFAMTEAGQKSNRIPSVVHAYVDLAKGMSLVAEHLGNQQESEARNQLKRRKKQVDESEEENEI